MTESYRHHKGIFEQKKRSNFETSKVDFLSAHSLQLNGRVMSNLYIPFSHAQPVSHFSPNSNANFCLKCNIVQLPSNNHKLKVLQDEIQVNDKACVCSATANSDPFYCNSIIHLYFKQRELRDKEKIMFILIKFICGFDRCIH